MSSKNHSCIFFLGLDTYYEGAISQVDDAMLSVIASWRISPLKTLRQICNRYANYSLV